MTTNPLLPISGALLVAASATLVGAQTVEPFTLDDLDFIVGEGENLVGFAIDWNGGGIDTGGAAPSLAWGFRFDDPSVTAEDALRAILAEDPRLFGKFEDFGGGLGTAALGLGYDANGDGEFGVVNALGQEESFNEATGVSTVTEETSAVTLDPADAYAEGFAETNFFWNLSFTSSSEAAGFSSAPTGISSLTLQADTFLAFAVNPLTAPFQPFFPEDIVAAEPPDLLGDFNDDGFVDAADFVVLRDTGGNADAFAAFVSNFNPAVSTPAVSTVAVPEPHACGLVLIALAGFGLVGRGGELSLF